MLKVLGNHWCISAEERIAWVFLVFLLRKIFLDIWNRKVYFFPLDEKNTFFFGNLSFVFLVFLYNQIPDKVNQRMQNNHQRSRVYFSASRIIFLPGYHFESLSSCLVEDTGKMHVVKLVLIPGDLKLTILLHYFLFITAHIEILETVKDKAVRGRLCCWPSAALCRASFLSFIVPQQYYAISSMGEECSKPCPLLDAA